MSTAVAQALQPGLTLSQRYRLVRPIGRGGMGSVWEVVHTRLGRQFALKVMSDDLMDDGNALIRFRREADLVASLRHPNIIEIVDLIDLENGLPCIVMEYLDGEDLSARIKHGGAQDWPTIAMVGEQILSALAVAHKQGIVHRDLKPRNIFMAKDAGGGETSKLLDFGLSKSLSQDSLTVSSVSGIGTPAYMSPEQADGRLGSIGPASDVWAMGVVLFEMATGELPFMGASPMATLYAICHADPAPIRELRPDAPEKFVAAIEGALTRDVDERWPSVDVLREKLEEAFEDVAPATSSGRRIATPRPPASAPDVHTESAESATPSASASDTGRNTGKRRKIRNTSALRETMLDTGSGHDDHTLVDPIAPEPEPAIPEVTELVERPGAKRPTWILGVAGAVAVGMAAFLLLGRGESGSAGDSKETAPAAAPVEPPPAPTASPEPEPAAAGAAAQAAADAGTTASGGDAETPGAPSAIDPDESAAPQPESKETDENRKKRPRKKSSKRQKPDDKKARERGKPINPF